MSTTVHLKRFSALEGCDVPTLLKFSWAVVVSTITDTNTVTFGVVEEPSCRDQPIIPFRLNILPEYTLREANEASERVCSDGAATEEVFHSVLAIQKDGSSRCCNIPESAIDHHRIIIRCSILDNVIRINISQHQAPNKLYMSPLDRLRHVLNRLAQEPHITAKELRDMHPKEIEQLEAWNSQVSIKSEQASILNLIEKQCHEQSSAPALFNGLDTLTYADLNEWASQIATRLVACAIAPDVFVSVLMEKSIWTTVSILAVLKAGGAFVLLDPSQPLHRLQYMHRKVRARLVLASKTTHAIASDLGSPVIIIPTDLTPLEGDASAPKEGMSLHSTPALPHHVVYVSFTSGSTGEPKGVALDNTAVSSGVNAFIAATKLTQRSRVLQFASYAFVVSIIDQLIALACGACLCVPSADQMDNDPMGTINTLGADWMLLTPSFVRLLNPEMIQSPTTIVLTGEAASGDEISKWHARVNLYILYGQTENSKGTSVSQRLCSTSDPRNIGRPFAAIPWIVSAHDHNRLVPVGAEGELLLESPCLSRGYWENKEETRATFVDDPTWVSQLRLPNGKRFLKTGDIARFEPRDGSIQMVGRKGTGIKIRGQRVELAEVEHHLCGRFSGPGPIVVEFVIPAGQDQRDAMLVAFVPVNRHSGVCKDVGKVSFLPPSADFKARAREVISELGKVLPTFAIPAAFTVVQSIPWTATGKLNRRMLRERASQLTRPSLLESLKSDTPFVVPRTETEHLVRRLCATTLKQPPDAVGMQANFFDLGGDSITARDLVARLRECRLAVRVADIFEQPTLAALSSHLSLHAFPMEDAPTPRVDPYQTLRREFIAQALYPHVNPNLEDILPVTSYQARVANAHEQDYYAFMLEGPVDVSRLQRACDFLIQKHAALRSIFLPFEGGIVQAVLREVSVPFLCFDLGGKKAELMDWATSFCKSDMTKKHTTEHPSVLFALGHTFADSSHHMLIIRLCHAQTDGQALNTVFHDLWATYDNQETEEPCDLSQYARDCVWERSPATVAFWRDTLQGSSVTRMPVARIENPGPMPPPWELELKIPIAPIGTTSTLFLADGSCTLWERQLPLPMLPGGITLATVLKAAWARVLCILTGNFDLVFGQFVNRRNTKTPRVNQLVQCCVSVSPVRVQAAPNMTSREVLQMVQRQHAESIEHEVLEWSDMSTNCTDWPRDAQPTSFVMCQNFEQATHGQAGKLRWKKAIQVLPYPTYDALVWEAFPSDSHLLLSLSSMYTIATKPNADLLFGLYGNCLSYICDFPDQIFAPDDQDRAKNLPLGNS